MTMRWMKFSDWRENGYRIRAGMKSTKRDDKGTPLFNEHQVERRKSNWSGILPGDSGDHANGNF